MSIQNNFPAIKPSLNLDFANTKVLDPRITFTRASTATYYDAFGVMRTAAAGQARFDHDPTTGESLGLLIEEARTNRALWSEDFTNIVWAKTNLTVTANQVIAPDGTLTADLLTATASNATLIFDAGTVASTGKTGSIFVRRKTGTGDVQLTMDNGATWTTQTITNTGWTRCTISQTLADEDFGIRLTTSGDEVYVWGAQLESGTALHFFPTSYIKTEAAQATRNADAASMTGTNFSSWYRADAGTMYGEAITYRNNSADGNTNAYIFGIYTVGAALRTNGLALFRNGSNVRALSGDGAGTTFTATVTGGSWPDGQFTKAAAAYDSDEAVGAALGLTPVSTAFTSSKGQPDILVLGQSWNTSYSTHRINGTIKKLAYYPARLTDTQLQALTA
jgi:hypothetical protein